LAREVKLIEGLVGTRGASGLVLLLAGVDRLLESPPERLIVICGGTCGANPIAREEAVIAAIEQSVGAEVSTKTLMQLGRRMG